MVTEHERAIIESNAGEEIATLKAKVANLERMLQAMKNEIYVIRSKTGV